MLKLITLRELRAGPLTEKFHVAQGCQHFVLRELTTFYFWNLSLHDIFQASQCMAYRLVISDCID